MPALGVLALFNSQRATFEHLFSISLDRALLGFELVNACCISERNIIDKADSQPLSLSWARIDVCDFPNSHLAAGTMYCSKRISFNFLSKGLKGRSLMLSLFSIIIRIARLNLRSHFFSHIRLISLLSHKVAMGESMFQEALLSRVMKNFAVNQSINNSRIDFSVPGFFYELDNWQNEPVVKPFFVIKTKGCSYKLKTGGCSVCGYNLESSGGKDIQEKLILNQVHIALSFVKSLKPRMVAITPVGSFLDDEELPFSARELILQELKPLTHPFLLQIESRPEYIIRAEHRGELDALSGFVGQKKIAIGIGLETSSDLIRKYSINKGFDFSSFTQASQILHEHGALVIAYLLLKPPFLNEKQALDDCLKSISDSYKSGADLVDVSLLRVYPNTILSWLFERKLYRPPWLWTAVRLLKELPDEFKRSTAVATWGIPPYSENLPYNCPKCSETINWYLQMWRLTRNRELLDAAFNFDCACKSTWENEIGNEGGSLHKTFEENYKKLQGILSE